MLRFAPPFRGRYIASTRGGVTENIARISVSMLAACAGTVAHEGSATISTSIGVSASGQQTDQQHYGTATVGVVISSTASASVTSTHSGTATASIVITTTAAGETGATHSGTANIGVTISASSSGTVVSPVTGVASCQVNLSVSASGFNTNTIVPDETTNSNDMTLYNSPSFTSDAAVGTRATDFTRASNATSHAGVINSDFESVFQSPFSISLWVKPDDGMPDTSLSSTGIFSTYKNPTSGVESWEIESSLDTAGKVRFRIKETFRGGGTNSYTTIKTTTNAVFSNGSQSAYKHLVYTFNSSGPDKLYVNGSSVSLTTDNGNIAALSNYTNGGNLQIGAFAVFEFSSGVNITNGWDGKIDDISIWSKALTNTEVSNLYNSGSGSDLTGSSDLEGWWKMGEHSLPPVTHSGTATVSVGVTASANGDLLELHLGTASCQVNLSASASGSSVTPAAYSNTYSIDLDGTNDYIDVSSFDPSTEIGTGAFTMSMWMKPDASTNQIFWYMGNSSKTTMMRLNHLDSSSVAYGFKLWANINGTWTNQYPHVSISTSTGTWYHVAVVRSGTTVTLYVNGTNSDSKTHASLGTGFGSVHNVGNYINSHHLDGHVDEYALWDEALTSTEIEAIYNSGIPMNLASDSGNYTSSANLVGYWRMEEGSGTSIADSSTNSNAATLTNGPTFSTDVLVAYTNEYSLNFDGTNDYLSTNLVTNTYSLKDGFSASLWVKLDDVSTTQDFFGRYGANTSRFYFGITGSNVRAAIGTAVDTSTLSHGMSTGTWCHVAYTFSGGSSGTFTYYLNGSSIGTIAFTWTTDSGSYEPMHIGALKNGTTLDQNPTNGKLDELALYNSTLSASDIAAIYNGGAPADQSSDSNLVAYWRMEENTGTTVADSSSNSNTATLTNGPTFSSDVPVYSNNYSIELDGTNQYLSVSDHNDFSFGNSTSDSAFSVAAWIKMDDATKFRIFSKQTNSSNIEYVFGVDGLDRLGVNLYDGATSNYRGVYSSSIQSYEGSWIHVVMTYDGTGGSTAYNGMKLYLNGSALSTSNNSGGGYTAMHNTTTDVWIGGANFVPDYANGKIDEVAVFSAELTSTQVSNIYNSGTPTNLSSESNLVGYWRMEENTGTTVLDSSSNGHTATLNNSPTFNTDVPS